MLLVFYGSKIFASILSIAAYNKKERNDIMCGFVGICNLRRDISNEIEIIKDMNLKLKKRGPDEEGYYLGSNIILGHRRLVIIDKENGKQPMSVKYNGITYTIVYNGQIYNKDEIRKELEKLGHCFKRVFRHRSFT